MIPYVRIRVPPPLISLLLSLDKGYSRHLVKAKSIYVTMRTQTNVYKKVQYGAILSDKVSLQQCYEIDVSMPLYHTFLSPESF